MGKPVRRRSPEAISGECGSLPVAGEECQTRRCTVSYHIRNVPVLCTIEMSPSFRFTKPQKRSAFSFADIDFFSTDDQVPECRIWVSGMGARGKGRRPFPRSSL